MLETPPGPVVTIDGREFLYFVGTGYLGLQGHPDVIRAASDAVRQFGIGSANSRTAFGSTPPVLKVERTAAVMFDVADAFYFASGWMGANILLQLFAGQSAQVFIDEHSHYSLFEAAQLAGGPLTKFRHRQAADLRVKLVENLRPGQHSWVLSDGVFAATGAIAPLDEYAGILCEYPGSVLCVDDAHGWAVLGQNGRGTLEHFGLWRQDSLCTLGAVPAVGAECESSNVVEANTNCKLPLNPQSQISKSPNLSIPPCPALLCCGTLSKAIGGYGGIIPGSRELIERIRTQSPYYSGVSPPPAPVAAASAKALEIVMAQPELRSRLWSNARLLKDGLRGLGFPLDDSPVPIASLVIGTANDMRRLQSELMARGIAVAYMASYAGLGAEGALRLAVFATHTTAMIQQLLDELRRLV